MQGFARPTLVSKERGDGVRILVGALQQMGGHNPEGPGKVDSGFPGGNLQLRKRRKKPGITDGQVCG